MTFLKVIQKKITDLSLTNTGFIIILFFVCLLAFGLLLPWLGLYWDDWPVTYIAHAGDYSVFWDFFRFDRPISAWTYVATFPVLGTHPFNWQLFTWVLSFISALTMWLVLDELWPRRKFTSTAAALLFAVYPAFSQQVISVAYSQHFITYSLFFVSLWAMLRAQGSEERFWLWTALSLLCQGVHLATMEYFSGLELTRPVLMLLYFRERSFGLSESWKRSLKQWLPYLALTFVFLFWRFYFLNLPGVPNQPSLLSDLIRSPLSTSVVLIERMLQDFIHVLFAPWNDTINTDLIDFSDLSVVFSLVLGILATALVAWFLRRRVQASAADKSDEKEWGTQAIGFGLVSILLGMVPIRLAELNVLSGLFSDRFTLPALFGAALAWVGLARLTLARTLHRALLVAILIGLSVGKQVRTANNYRWDWEEQQRNYWQLYWRAPSIREDTALVFEGAFSAYVSEYSAAFAINTLYDAQSVAGRLPYWVLDFYDDVLPNQGSESVLFSKELRNFDFEAKREDSLYFIGSGSGRCLWLLTTLDEHNQDVPVDMRRIASSSALRRIGTQAANVPNPQIFGPEPAKEWCYYFQKIALANQEQDWALAGQLWNEASAKRLHPNNQFEMIPVIQALGMLAEWQKASELSLDVYRKQPNVQASLCYLWANWPETELLEALDCGSG